MIFKNAQLSPTLQPHGPQPARLLCLWDSPGKDTGVGCRFLLQEKYIAKVCVLSWNSFAYFKVTTLKNYLPPRFFFFSRLGKRERKQDKHAPNFNSRNTGLSSHSEEWGKCQEVARYLK